MKYIDIRSDTVTRPSPAMLQAMMQAEVGDDVFGEDPTVNKLQKDIAAMFGKSSALFVPSGTMGNEVCVKVHTNHGDEVIVDEDAHIAVYETAGPAFLSGVQLCPIRSNKGVITASAVKEAIRYKAYYMPRTRLICLENTHGRSGGTVFPMDELKRIREVSLEEKIALHMDGARIWNASVAGGVSPKEYGRFVDSLSVCFSKGLGAPVGSIVIGSEEFIDEARRYRKLFGGGMRQAGILAAAALYAIGHNVDRLAEDHAKAKFFAGRVGALNQLSVDASSVQTNMVIIDTSRTGKSQSEVLQLLKSKGVLLTPERSSSIRAVFHLDVSTAEVESAVRVFESSFA